MRRGMGSRKLDTSDLMFMVQRLINSQPWSHVGRVIAPQGEGSHWERDGANRVLVEVETLPEQVHLTCRLDSHGGIWSVPTVGTLVGVIIPDGKPDHMPIIAAILGGNASPDRVGDGRVVWAPGLPIEIECDDIKLGSHTATERAMYADAFTSDISKAMTKVLADLTTAFTALSLGVPTSTADLTALLAGISASKYQSPKVRIA
jgi:hypothetical protein